VKLNLSIVSAALAACSVAAGDEPLTIKGYFDHVVSVAFSPDSKLVAAGDRSGVVKVWNAADGASIAIFREAGENEAAALAFSADSQSVFVGVGHALKSNSMPGAVERWALTTRGDGEVVKGSAERIATSAAHGGKVSALALSPNGRYLFAGDRVGTVAVLGAAKLDALHVFKVGVIYNNIETKLPIDSLALSVDGECWTAFGFVNGYHYGFLHTGYGAEAGKISLPDYPKAGAFSPDGKVLAVGKSTVVWVDVAATLAAKWPQPRVDPKIELKPASIIVDIASMAYSADGKLLALLNRDEVLLWDVVGKRQLPSATGHAFRITAIAFSPDSKLLATTSADKTVKIWSVAKLLEAEPPVEPKPKPADPKVPEVKVPKVETPKVPVP